MLFNSIVGLLMVFYVTERNQGKDEVTRCAEVRTDIQVLRSSKLLEGS